MTIKQLVFSDYAFGILCLYALLGLDFLLLFVFQDYLLTPNMRTIVILQMSAAFNIAMYRPEDVNEYGHI